MLDRPFDIPDEPGGEQQSLVFIRPAGVRYTMGDLGTSIVLDLGSAHCHGRLCGFLLER